MPLAHQRCAKWMLFTHQALFPISLRTCTACTLAPVVTHSAGSPSASCYRFVFLVIYASPHTTRAPCSRMLSRCPALKWVCAHVNGSFTCAPCRSAPPRPRWPTVLTGLTLWSACAPSSSFAPVVVSLRFPCWLVTGFHGIVCLWAWVNVLICAVKNCEFFCEYYLKRKMHTRANMSLVQYTTTKTKDIWRNREKENTSALKAGWNTLGKHWESTLTLPVFDFQHPLTDFCELRTSRTLFLFIISWLQDNVAFEPREVGRYASTHIPVWSTHSMSITPSLALRVRGEGFYLQLSWVEGVATPWSPWRVPGPHWDRQNNLHSHFRTI